MKKYVGLPETATILTVNLKGYDEENINGDVLLDARRRYFSAKKKIRNKVFFTHGIESIHCQYQICPNKPMKWKKTVNTKLTEYIQSDTSGSYTLICLDLSGELRKKLFFSSNHIWLKTEYYNGNGVLIAQLTGYRNEDGSTVALSCNGSKPIILSAYSDKLIYPKEAEAVVQTTAGVFYLSGNVPDDAPKTISISDNVERRGFFFDTALIYGGFTTLNIRKSTGQASQEIEDNNSIKESSSNAPTLDLESKTDGETIIRANDQGKSQNQAEELSEDKSTPVLKSSITESENSSLIIQGNEKYHYYGNLNKDGQRHGGGVTLTPKGSAIYSGGYSDDKRSGFGAQFFKNGKICYVGSWREDKKNGFGFSIAGDGTITAGNFEDDKRKGLTAKFKGDGSLMSVIGYSEGQTSGLSFTLDRNSGNYHIYKSEGGKPLSPVTVIDRNGSIIYHGDIANGEYDGSGKLFDKNGLLSYCGQFKNSLKNGEGTIYLQDGSTISGTFLNGELDGDAVHRSKNGTVIYKGGFKDGEYSGKGILYRDDGSYCYANFEKGREKGSISVFTHSGELIYKGGIKNGEYSGKGTLYEKNVKVYDGSFVAGKKSGMGRLFKDNLCIYMGSFENDKKSGFGISYKNNKAEYSGFWADDVYNGCGVFYDSEVKIDYAGMFKNGEMCGRINEISDGLLLRECLYENGVCSYMREYDEDGAVVYEGSVVNSLREGMGCAYTEYGEKKFEGIFKFGEPYKAMRVIPKSLPKLDYCEQLKDTPYFNFKRPLDFASEKLIGRAIYSGSLKNNKPSGNGTLLYPDHRYTGGFIDGKPNGAGVLYFGDGKELRGEFFPSAMDDTDIVEFNDAVYYVKKSDQGDDEQII